MTHLRRAATITSAGLLALLVSSVSVLPLVGFGAIGAGADSHAADPAGATPNLVTAVSYLTNSTNLVDGDHYEPFGPGFADIGLTIDGALALAATRTDSGKLTDMVGYVEANGDSWTGIGTPYVSGGSVGKEALLAEVVGDDPRVFGGRDLITAVDQSVCTAPSVAPDTTCAAAGNFADSPSVFSQSLGILAQLRADDSTNAASPIQYLESLQDPDGGWPTLIPPGADPESDVDSTGMAVMALDLVPGAAAAAAVQSGIAWIAGQQEIDGGFPGTSGDNTNSAALALMALNLDHGTYATSIRAGRAFLAAQQNPDGGFNVSSDPGSQQGSDLRASTQAVSGTVGTSLGTLSSIGPPVIGDGYWEVSADGGVFGFGDATFHGSMGGTHLNAPVVGIASTPDGDGYWEVSADGGVFGFGDATFHGSMGGTHLNAPVVGIASTPDGDGYWEVSADGGVFGFGDATFHGSMGGTHLNAPVVGIASTPDGDGYWEVSADGGVFGFGDATFHGSMGGTHLNAPVVGIASTPDGDGYWEVSADGGVFGFGDATFHGSMGGTHLNAPVVGIASTPDGDGYWEVSADGGVFGFGDATFHGSMGGTHLNAPVVGTTSTFSA